MKNKNHGKSERALAFALVFVLLVLTSCHQVNDAQILVKTTPTDTIVFEGTLEKLASDPGSVSGIDLVYRLAKYRVDKVCEGKYDGREIVVDHLIFDLKQFEGINLNDRVCVSVKISNNIVARQDADGIRSPSDDIKIFYIATEKIRPINSARTCCGKTRARWR